MLWLPSLHKRSSADPRREWFPRAPVQSEGRHSHSRRRPPPLLAPAPFYCADDNVPDFKLAPSRYFSAHTDEQKPSIGTAFMNSVADSVSSPVHVFEEAREAKPAPPPKERRFKLSRACDRCRRRRIKCDEGHPCQSCLVASSPCTFEEPGKRTHPHKSKRAATLEDRMHHLESLIQSIPFNLFNAQVGASSTNSTGAYPQSPASGGDSASPHASFASATHAYPLGVPPPSLSLFPLMNPSTHFPTDARRGAALSTPASTANVDAGPSNAVASPTRSAVSPSYLYLDDEGYTRWQGETSGLPLLDFLVERCLPSASANANAMLGSSPVRESWSRKSENVTTGDWFPDRQPRQIAVHPETMWKLITSMIVPELMDSLVQCFLSTTYYLMPFLHVPTFLADYGNPQKWGEPGFASFIVAICCLSSRHVDDPRVRADPLDGNSAGAHWFELFAKLRTVPTADRPTLYTVQSVFVAGVYAIGLGKLSRGFALLAEATTLSIDAGLHRSAEAYDCFGPLEEQVRLRTFWCVYMWDKQAAAAFGRPPVLCLRDCDAPEPAQVDDEYITNDGVGPQPAGVESRLGAFVACLRLSVLLEAVLTSPQTYTAAGSPFLARAASMLSANLRGGDVFTGEREKDLSAEEALLDDVLRELPPFWAHTTETMASADVLRVTQAERLHCLERFVRMLIERHRFSRWVAARLRGDGSGVGGEGERMDAEREAMLACHACAVELVHAHMTVAKKGLMTYYGVHVIHQLTQAGRTLIAVLLNCKTEDLQPLVPPSLEALRSCVGLLRRFSGRYICGLRSGELIEEFCRLTGIPLDAPLHVEAQMLQSRPPWIRPVRKKSRAARDARASSSSGESRHGSPAEDAASPAASFSLEGTPGPGPGSMPSSSVNGYSAALGFEGLGGDGVSRSGSRGGSLLADLQDGVLGLGGMSHMSGSGGGADISGVGDMGVGGLGDVGMDGMGGMSSAALMTLLNDGSFDMNALFSTDFGTGGATPKSPNGHGHGNGDGIAMMGIVGTP